MRKLDKKISWLVGISCIVIIMLNLRFFSPLVSFEITAEELYVQNSNQTISMQEETGTVAVGGEGESMVLVSPTYKLPVGGYKVEVLYSSNVDNTGNKENKVAEVSFISYDNPSAVLFDTIQLGDGSQLYSTRIWNQGVTAVEDLTMKTTYYGQGEFSFSKITIEESFVYRIVRLLVTSISVITIMLGGYFMVLCPKTNASIRKAKYIGVFLAAVVFASLPLFQNYLIHSGDLFYHLNRITAVATELENGIFPVRISFSDLNNYGYANSLFYCDIFLYIPAVLYNCMLPLRTCYQFYVILINVATILVTYYSFNLITDDKKISMLGGVLYLLAPYRFTNVYNRSAVGEYTAMVFLPLIVTSMYLIYTKEKIKRIDWMLLAIGMSGLIMSHILSTQMCVLFLGITCVIFIKKTFRRECMLALLKASGLTILLTAWFIVPFMQSMLMSTQVLESGVWKIQSHGIYLLQLFSLFSSAIGYSMTDTLTGDMPISLGVSSLIGLICVFYCCLYRSRVNDASKTFYQGMLTITGLAFASIVFTLQAFPWDNLEDLLGTSIATILTKIQFPWRYLTISTVLIVGGTVMSLVLLKGINLYYYKYATVLLVATTVIYCSFFYYGFMEISYCFSNADKLDVDTLISHMGFEYMLEGTDTELLNISEVQVSADTLLWEGYTKKGGEAYVSVNNMSSTSEYITLPILNYNNYQAYDEGTEEQLQIINGANNCITIEVEPYYEGILKVDYVTPLLWRIMEVISGITVIYVCMLLSYGKWRKRV